MVTKSAGTAIMPLEQQDDFWGRVVSDYHAKITYLDQVGENKLRMSADDLGVRDGPVVAHRRATGPAEHVENPHVHHL